MATQIIRFATFRDFIFADISIDTIANSLLLVQVINNSVGTLTVTLSGGSLASPIIFIIPPGLTSQQNLPPDLKIAGISIACSFRGS